MAPDAERLQLPPRIVGRYALFDEIAAGGMATVHVGRMLGPVGFSRTVAIKRLHPQFAKDPDFVSMFVDEARLASRIQHPNVVATVDVVQDEGELLLVMEYIVGESLSKLVKAATARGEAMPPDIVAGIMTGMLYGLHAAHEAMSEEGQPLNIVHRDISPQNVLVGVDGVARVLDFGVAKAAMRSQSTRDGEMKGKLSYMSPEQLNAKTVDRRSDIFAAGVVCWEALCGRRLFGGQDAGAILAKILSREIEKPSAALADRSLPGATAIPARLDQIVMKALDKRPERRFQTAREFAIELENATGVASARRVGEWVSNYAAAAIQERSAKIAGVEKQRVSFDDVSEAEQPSNSGIIIDDTATRVDTPSHVQPERDAGDTTRPRRRRWWVALAALCLLVGAWFAFAWRGASSASQVAAEPTPSAAVDEESAQDAVVSATSQPLEPEPPPTDIEPAPSSASAKASEDAPTPEASTKPVPARTRVPSRRNCNPPYYVDSAGIRRPKNWCL